MTCENCIHSKVCKEVESLKCRKDFIWYRAESGCPYLSEENLGTWVTYSSTMMECSSCKKHVPYHRYKYCPHCGSKNKKEAYSG
jgi:hypothetical protein